MASTRSTARPSRAGIVWMNRGWETGEAGWNHCRIWVGSTAYCIGPNAPDPHGTNRIEVAETTRGWEFATHILGGSYGIGNITRERICATRKAAIVAAADEALGYINHRLSYSGSNGLNASERKRVEALRDWAEQVKAEAY